MKVSQVMTRNVRIVNPEQSIREVARTMTDMDVGALPVAENDRLVGMITDRDIAIRAVGEGKSPKTKVRDVMSAEVLYCFEDQELEDVARNMGNIKVRRLPVVTRDKHLTGILSISDLAMNEHANTTAQTLAEISQSGGVHSQRGH